MRYPVLPVLSCALAVAACQGPLDTVNDAATDPKAPAWVHAQALAERTSTAADAAARVWDGSPSGLDGWTVDYVSGPFIDCDGTHADGCSYSNSLGGGTMRIRVEVSATCLEATSLVHEVGHAIIGDHDHHDPRWSDPQFWRRMRRAVLDVLPSSDVACGYAVASSPAYRL